MTDTDISVALLSGSMFLHITVLVDVVTRETARIEPVKRLPAAFGLMLPTGPCLLAGIINTARPNPLPGTTKVPVRVEYSRSHPYSRIVARIVACIIGLLALRVRRFVAAWSLKLLSAPVIELQPNDKPATLQSSFATEQSHFFPILTSIDTLAPRPFLPSTATISLLIVGPFTLQRYST